MHLFHHLQIFFISVSLDSFSLFFNFSWVQILFFPWLSICPLQLKSSLFSSPIPSSLVPDMQNFQVLTSLLSEFAVSTFCFYSIMFPWLDLSGNYAIPCVGCSFFRVLKCLCNYLNVLLLHVHLTFEELMPWIMCKPFLSVAYSWCSGIFLYF